MPELSLTVNGQRRSLDAPVGASLAQLLREHLGGRWLTAEYRMGDILIFGMRTVHASLDNQTHFFRFSTDTRYQPASEPIDGRWIGENPIGHGLAAKRSMIC